MREERGHNESCATTSLVDATAAAATYKLYADLNPQGAARLEMSGAAMIQTKAAVAAIACHLVSLPSGATYNATATGAVVHVRQDSPALGYAAETFTLKC